jgi:hypothetical protein
MAIALGVSIDQVAEAAWESELQPATVDALAS